MSKLRVYEYAKQQNMPSKEIINILGRVGVNVTNHMSVMDAPMVEHVEMSCEKSKNPIINLVENGEHRGI